MNISCDCQSSRPSPKKLCCPKGVEIDYVELPASLGTSAPGQPNAPENGAYKNAVVKYVADGHVYIYTSEGIPVLLSDGSGGGSGDVISVNGKTGEVVLTTSDLENDSDYQTGDEVVSAIENAISQLEIPTNVSELTNDAGYQTASEVASAVAGEATLRQSADNNLQSQIDALSASSDVTDIVGTYAELQAYDTSKLKDNDIIKVLQDESRNNETTYYRWSTTTQTFTLIGEEGPYYTKSQADGRFVAQTTYTTDKAALEAEIATKQDELTAGNNVQISGSVISATDTTYSDFTGTDGQTAGTAGLVPAPATTDVGKFLKADGTWDTAGGGFDPYSEARNRSDVYIPDGSNYNATYTSVVISPSGLASASNINDRSVNILGNTPSSSLHKTVQIGFGSSVGGNNAVAISGLATSANGVAIGDNSVAGQDGIAIGRANSSGGRYGVAIGGSTTSGNSNVAVGNGSKTTGTVAYGVALGALAEVARSGEVNIGTGTTTNGYNSTSYRVLGGVHPAVDDHDAVTLGQMNARILAGGTAAPTTSTVGEVGTLYAYVESGTGHLAICTAVDASTSTYTWQTLI